MQTLTMLGVLGLAYLVGSIPIGFIMVKVSVGKDIREIESGRIGGTNAMRAAGNVVGYVTTLLDILKGASTVWIAKTIFPENAWMHILAPILGIIGHNYSIYLIRKDERGNLCIGGGAGGTPTLGGATGLWWPNILILIPIGLLIFYGVGYASITTMTIPILVSLIFSYRAIWLGEPWEYILFGFLAETLVLWSLRPNIKRLLNGNERVVGNWHKEKQ